MEEQKLNLDIIDETDEIEECNSQRIEIAHNGRKKKTSRALLQEKVTSPI